MKMIQVVDGVIVQYQLPKVGKLKDGSSVSGYDILPLETLIDEGWLPLEDIQPEINIDTQYLVRDGYEILAEKVVIKYRIEDIIIEEPIPSEPTEIEILQQENEKLKAKLYETESIVAETSATQEMLIELLLDLGVM